MLCPFASKLLNVWHVSAPGWKRQQFQSSYYNQVTEKQVVSLFNTFDNVLMFENLCKIYVGRIYQQLHNSKCYIYENIFLLQRGWSIKKKIRSFWFIRFSILCVSQQYIIGILNFSWSLHTNKPQVLFVWSNDLVFCHERELTVQTKVYTVLCHNIDSLHNTLQVIFAHKAKPKQKLIVPDII